MRLPGDFTFHRQADPWLSWHYITANSDAILSATRTHVTLTLESVALGLLVAIPLAALARQRPWLRSAVLNLSTAIYAIPSLAFVVAMIRFFELSPLTVVIPLASYSLVILVRNILTGLDEVDAEAVDAARGMGMSNARVFVKVRLPIALPAVMAGLRLAVVSTIELVVIGGYVGQGGYGSKIFDAFSSRSHTELTTYIVLTVLLALVADALLLLAQRMLTPWRRAAAA
ncbi:MAG TPA: ABC transporter permease subunit [Mycobacteriales bacterium]|jgi:osmoprotectant transport system permease protein|nr:ABC transporter permease subunit [Mycobacteriales bacterium]